MTWLGSLSIVMQADSPPVFEGGKFVTFCYMPPPSNTNEDSGILNLEF